jgi:hypothetical protein
LKHKEKKKKAAAEYLSLSLSLCSVGWFVGTTHDRAETLAISMIDGGHAVRQGAAQPAISSASERS